MMRCTQHTHTWYFHRHTHTYHHSYMNRYTHNIIQCIYNVHVHVHVYKIDVDDSYYSDELHVPPFRALTLPTHKVTKITTRFSLFNLCGHGGMCNQHTFTLYMYTHMKAYTHACTVYMYIKYTHTCI